MAEPTFHDPARFPQAAPIDQWRTERVVTIEGPFVVTALWGEWRFRNMKPGSGDAGNLMNVPGGAFGPVAGMRFFIPEGYQLSPENPPSSGGVHMISGYKPRSA